MKYYRLDKVMKACPDAKYYVIYSGRSDGKTFAVLELMVKKYFEGKGSGAIIRRWDTDFAKNTGRNMFNGIVVNNLVTKYSHGKWSGVRYYAGAWYFTRENSKGETVSMKTPFCYAFALTMMEHQKSSSFDEVTTVLYDEFIGRQGYIPDEFSLLMNVISTIVRNRDNVTIFMCGNTVNPYNPYFDEMGLYRAKTQKQGTIDVYTYGESGLKVAVEYAEKRSHDKPSNIYFAFNNPKLKMITDGAWEIAVYPHRPCEIRPKDIAFMYFIKFGDETLQCEIVQTDKYDFTYIHRKTGKIKHPDDDLVFQQEYDPRPNYRRRITKPTDDLTRRIAMYFAKDKVFYQDNLTGETMRNYLMWSSTDSPLKK